LFDFVIIANKKREKQIIFNIVNETIIFIHYLITIGHFPAISTDYFMKGFHFYLSIICGTIPFSPQSYSIFAED